MQPKSFAMLGLLAALWGASFLFMRVGAPALGPIFMIEMRVLIAGIALLVIAMIRKHPVQILHKWKSYLVLGGLNAAIPFCLIATAELHLSASLAAILNATTPLFTALIAWGWLKEAFTVRKFVGLVIGILGVTILVGWDPQNSDDFLGWSILFSLLAALCYGVAGVFSSRYFKGESSMDMAIGQQLTAAVLLLPFSAVALPTAMPSTEVVVSVLALAIFCTAVGYLLYFSLVQQIGPVRTLTVTFLVPFFGIIWGAVFLGEAVTGGVAAGLLLILLSVALVVKR